MTAVASEVFRPEILGLMPEDLVRVLGERGVGCTITEARRVCAHVISHSRGDLSELIRPIRRPVRDAIEQEIGRSVLEVVERSRDETDGFVKYLFRHPDGALTEAVRIPLEKKDRFTLCLSSR
jgi:23S rRNA (adenine2503-C2)-methyltransferase